MPEAGQAGVSVRAKRPRATFDPCRQAGDHPVGHPDLAQAVGDGVGQRVDLPPRSAPPSAAWISTSRPPSYFLSAVR